MPVSPARRDVFVTGFLWFLLVGLLLILRVSLLWKCHAHHF